MTGRGASNKSHVIVPGARHVKARAVQRLLRDLLRRRLVTSRFSRAAPARAGEYQLVTSLA
jgi:hypothetical protein